GGSGCRQFPLTLAALPFLLPAPAALALECAVALGGALGHPLQRCDETEQRQDRPERPGGETERADREEDRAAAGGLEDGAGPAGRGGRPAAPGGTCRAALVRCAGRRAPPGCRLWLARARRRPRAAPDPPPSRPSPPRAPPAPQPRAR